MEVLRRTSIGLHSVASGCSRSDLATPMRQRAEQLDAAMDGLQDVIDEALRCCSSTGCLSDLRAALARIGEPA
jgi:hypothetical protein